MLTLCRRSELLLLLRIAHSLCAYIAVLGVHERIEFNDGI